MIYCSPRLMITTPQRGRKAGYPDIQRELVAIVADDAGELRFFAGVVGLPKYAYIKASDKQTGRERDICVCMGKWISRIEEDSAVVRIDRRAFFHFAYGRIDDPLGPEAVNAPPLTGMEIG